MRRFFGLHIRYANNFDYPEVNGTEVCFIADKDTLEAVMSDYYKEPVDVLFIDRIDNRFSHDTRITIGRITYYAFTNWIDIYAKEN